jgi:hypothetical protein
MAINIVVQITRFKLIIITVFIFYRDYSLLCVLYGICCSLSFGLAERYKS